MLKGILPTSSSYVRIPIDQISADWSYCYFRIISGDRYKGVPQYDFLISLNPQSAAHPKSQIFPIP